MTQLAEVEKILGGGNMQTFDSKADHEKLTSDAKTKSMKLFGDAKERKAAKKKEAQKQSTSCIKPWTSRASGRKTMQARFQTEAFG